MKFSMLNHLDNFFNAQIFEPQKGMLKFMEYFVFWLSQWKSSSCYRFGN